MGLRQRIILIVTIPAFLATAVHGILRVRQEQSQLLSEYQRSLALTSKAMQISIENALRDRQWADVGNLITQMVEQQDVIDRIRLFGRDGETIFISNPLKMADEIPAAELRHVITSGEPEQAYARRGTQSVVSVLLPVHGRTGRIDGAVEVAGIAAGLDRRLHAAILDVFIRLAVLLAVSVGLTALTLQRQVLRPLGRLAEGIQRLGRGEPGVALAVDRRDELGKVAQEFNEMAHRLQEARRALEAETERALALEQHVRQAATLSATGKLAAALAHEVGTPLNIVSARAELILRGRSQDDPVREDLEAIGTQIDRITRIITRLLEAVRPQAPKLEPTDARAVIADVAPLLRFAARQRAVTLVEAADDDLPVIRADAGQLHQVIVNLVVNALDATPSGGTVTVSACHAAASGTAGVAIAVADTGSGIAPELVGKVFEMFFTTKPRGQGTGMGLAICRDIVRGHGGRITLDSVVGAGTTFTVWLPADVSER